jgi:DNA-binding CsgD family transcriptional regulator
VPDDDEWYASPYYLTRHSPAGVDDFMISAYPLEQADWSTLVFWRSHDAAPFADRDRHVVHLVASEIDGLHRLRNEVVPANGEAVNLSPRQHQVLQLLLAGDGNKSIARKLKLSEHTVCDYVKALHARFKVNSRSQLLARFVGGRP